MRKSLIASVSSLIVAGALAALAATADHDLRKQAADLFKPVPSMVPAVQGNPVTRQKTELGKMLFFDTRLSASGVLIPSF
jgi:cytochrome c peroxidase